MYKQEKQKQRKAKLINLKTADQKRLMSLPRINDRITQQVRVNVNKSRKKQLD